jgi:hypothetical protein
MAASGIGELLALSLQLKSVVSTDGRQPGSRGRADTVQLLSKLEEALDDAKQQQLFVPFGLEGILQPSSASAEEGIDLPGSRAEPEELRHQLIALLDMAAGLWVSQSVHSSGLHLAPCLQGGTRMS